MARYCDNTCRDEDWPLHNHVCAEDVLKIGMSTDADAPCEEEFTRDSLLDVDGDLDY